MFLQNNLCLHTKIYSLVMGSSVNFNIIVASIFHHFGGCLCLVWLSIPIFQFLFSNSYFPILIFQISFSNSHFPNPIFQISFSNSQFPVLVFQFLFSNFHFPTFIFQFPFPNSQFPTLIFQLPFFNSKSSETPAPWFTLYTIKPNWFFQLFYFADDEVWT